MYTKIVSSVFALFLVLSSAMAQEPLPDTAPILVFQQPVLVAGKFDDVENLPIGNDPRTVSFFLKASDFSTQQFLFSWGTYGDGRYCGFFLGTKANTIGLMLYNKDFKWNSDIQPGVRTHILFTYTLSSLDVYVNGKLARSLPTSDWNTGAGPLFTGQRFNYNLATFQHAPVEGTEVTDLKIFKGSVSATRAASMYDEAVNPPPVVEDPPVEDTAPTPPEVAVETIDVILAPGEVYSFDLNTLKGEVVPSPTN